MAVNETTHRSRDGLAGPADITCVPVAWRDRAIGTASVLLAAAIVVAMVWREAPVLVLLFAVPIYLSYRSLSVFRRRIVRESRRVDQESEVHFAVIEAMAMAIEAKEPMARSHLQGLQTCAEHLARALEMSEADVQAVRTAALLHDLGNLAVPAELFRKKAPLTGEERRAMQSHARVGAELLRAVPFPRPVAPLILAHHERWDGRGYPDGLAGDAIPLGARILAVADLFTALQSHRPHRPAVSVDEALAIVRRSAGEALDPHVVQRLVAVLPSIRAKLEGPSAVRGLAATDGPSDHGALEEISAAHREEQALREIARAHGSSQGLFDAMMLLWLNLQDLVPTASCALFLWNDATDTFGCRFAAGENETSIRALESATIEGLTIPIGAATSFLAPEGWGVTLESAVACPLTLDDRTFGALVVYHAERDAYTSEHRRLLGRVARQATLVVRNALISDQTQAAALVDALTGLPNRRGWDLFLSRELDRARSDGTELALLNIDLDEFKRINDQYGHAAGDATLRVVAHVLRGALQPQDVCARLAGDEFLIALPACGRERASRRSAQIAAAVAGHPFDVQAGEPVTLSLSVGVSVFPHDGDSSAQLAAVADRRMYEAKGRHRAALVPAPAIDDHFERAATA